MVESSGHDGGHRKSLIPVAVFEVLSVNHEPAQDKQTKCLGVGLRLGILCGFFSATGRSSRNLWVFPQRCLWKWMLKAASSISRSQKTDRRTSASCTTKVKAEITELYERTHCFTPLATIRLDWWKDRWNLQKSIARHLLFYLKLLVFFSSSTGEISEDAHQARYWGGDREREDSAQRICLWEHQGIRASLETDSDLGSNAHIDGSFLYYIITCYHLSSHTSRKKN